ncbi:uncharacterized protein LOC129631279 isoform X3 [Bubalus kerabau]|uniref:uncharacterized protein LOC102397977 isoform X3 n=1 Tax=Bubalus bubalis TaxID=89462 RepID=UPI000DBC7A3E|nr:uncharacterized protein LOC102397977 isoform X2 [Bubalus bubalis]XP_044787532.1 uncharacterized protein LOC102397977 isoform X3 [Bubalus bubalis]XP_044787533.1 uncharacterized protein LOC102397977 isoform X3 [Bubalus bubalis]XP_044787534.1 uncharacterized protein LOC102397977 isoform X3 [Bubalus bubalis]XP_055408180.1 uncharacterized protein LOC129631279 isoform X3 [Bubalus carabanensis]XP_055408181.1 uncharacterized protein LOC129631279 isoform X3 [Bubalus carabanensis]XP_055408182.1 unch
MSPRVFGLAQRPALRRPGSAESPPPGRSALSLRVSADSCKPGSGARQVEVSQLSDVCNISYNISQTMNVCLAEEFSGEMEVTGPLKTCVA